ncbi:alpha/beta fold hydrolase [Capsulimonas corticalis]
MDTITMKDGAKIYYKDWGTGRPVVFCHGWPLSADAWDAQMLFLANHGYRVIAHDRRGHGRSSQTFTGNDMDTYADDLSTLIETLDLKDITLVGHSTGGGEVARYVGRHASPRIAKAVLISAVTPMMLKTDDNPEGAPREIFDGIRAGVLADRAQFYHDFSMPFYGYNKPDAKISQGVRDSFWQQGMMGSLASQYQCIKAFSETDFRGDLAKFTFPTLVMQGDGDQIVPITVGSLRTAKLVKGATLKVFPGAPHGLCTTLADQVNAELLAFIQA